MATPDEAGLLSEAVSWLRDDDGGHNQSRPPMWRGDPAFLTSTHSRAVAIFSFSGLGRLLTAFNHHPVRYIKAAQRYFQSCFISLPVGQRAFDKELVLDRRTRILC